MTTQTESDKRLNLSTSANFRVSQTDQKFLVDNVSKDTEEENIRQWKKKRALERKKITLWQRPIETMRIFLYLVWIWLKKSLSHILTKKYIVLPLLALLATVLLIYFIPGPHQTFVEQTVNIIKIVVWWVTLGILSSIGLGTGLHTFVLYLGPFIAQVTLAATECKSVNFATYGPNSFICPDENLAADPSAPVPSLLSILRLVVFEAFLWGLGTAIGELPPYFVARAARLAQDSLNSQTTDGSNDEEEEEEKPPRFPRLHALVEHIKYFIIKTLGRLGFVGIMLFASVPNPLFDLAGLTAGTTLVPFTTFFFATFIGKAIIKAIFVQSIFVITAFSKDHLVKTVNFIEWLFPFLSGKVQALFDEYRKQFHQLEGHSNAGPIKRESILSKVWDVVLLVMISYFIISLINSSVQKYLRDQDNEEIARRKIKQQ